MATLAIPEQVIKFKGAVTLIATDPRTGREVERLVQDNLIVTRGLGLMCDMLIDASAAYDTGLSYCALGTGATAVVAGDVELDVETSRKQITYRARSVGTLDIRTFFIASECSVNLKEVGLFGASATGAANSGIMFSRSLLSAGGFDNSAGLYDVTIAWTITLSAA